jgi:predicted kinase
MVTLLCGPPCSGKSTLAKRLAKPGDVVLDFDDICVELGSRDQWAHSQAVRHQAEAVMRTRMLVLGQSKANGYVIRTAPIASQREELAHLLGAGAVWVLDPGYAECVRRARTRPRGTVQAIRRWYARYTPSTVDEPCPWVEVVPAQPLSTSRVW